MLREQEARSREISEKLETEQRQRSRMLKQLEEQLDAARADLSAARQVGIG